MKIKTYVSIVALVMLIFVSACQEKGASSSDVGNEVDDPDAPTIAMSVINQEALFFTQMVKGAEEKAEELGVNLTVFNSNNKPIDQFNSIEDFVSQGVDAIVVNAIDVKGVEPAIKKAQEAGIHVISIDSVIDSEAVDVQVGVDNREASKRLGEYYLDYINNEVDGQEANLGVVSALNSQIQVNRQDGFVETVEPNENVNVVNVVDGENVQEKALTASENLFTGNPNMSTAFATGEPAFIGMVSATRSQNKTDDVNLFGWDLSKQVISGIDDGFVEAVVQQHPDKYGAKGVEAAMKLINGEDVESNINVPATIVTDENVDEFRHLFE